MPNAFMLLIDSDGLKMVARKIIKSAGFGSNDNI